MYLLFSFDRYYPAGGIGDFRGAAETIKEASKLYDGKSYDFGHIFCTEKLEIVKEFHSKKKSVWD